MENNKLNELNENVNKTINSLENLSKVLNNITTSEYEKKINTINKELDIQNKILNEYKKKSNTTNNDQIKNISSVLNQQKRLMKNFTFNQHDGMNNIDDSLYIVNKIGRVTDGLNFIENKINNVGGGSIKINGGKMGKIPQFADYHRPTISQPDLSEVIGFGARKSWKGAFKSVGDILEQINNPYTKAIGAALKGIAAVGEYAMKLITEISDISNTMANKLEETTGSADEAIRSSFQNMGLISTKMFGDKTKTDKIADNILNASTDLVQRVGIAFGPEQIAEFQKAYADITGTGLGFSKTDYDTIAEVQTTLDLSAQESADLSSTFIQMGYTVDNFSEFTMSLMETATASGVNSREILKNMKDYFKSSNTFKMGGGVQDMTRIMTYANRIKIDLNGMLSLMDSVSSPEDVIDLASKLSALDTAYLGLDPIDLWGAALNDADKFMKMITDPLRENVEKYYDKSTSSLTNFGVRFSRELLKLDGIDKVFKSVTDITKFFAKASKESDIKKTIKNSIDLSSYFQDMDPKTEDNMIGLLASQMEGVGENAKITDLNGKKLVDLKPNDLNELAKTGFNGKTKTEKLENAAVGVTSVQDQIKTNEMLVQSMSWTKDSINSVNKILTSDVIRNDVLLMIGNIIYDLGKYTLDDTTFKNVQLLHQYLGVSLDYAYLFNNLLEDNLKGLNNMVATLGYGMGEIDKVFGSGDYVPPKLIKHSYGGIIQNNYSIPKKYISSSPRFYSGSISSDALSELLSSFTTNKFGSGILTSSGGNGVTKIIVSGEIRNVINGNDAGAITGDKVLKILEKQLA